jgi:hypothetical protein
MSMRSAVNAKSNVCDDGIFDFNWGRRGGGRGLVANELLVPGSRNHEGNKAANELIAPPHGQHANELGASGCKKNSACYCGVSLHQLRQRFQALGLVGEGVLDCAEVVSGDGDGDGSHNCERVTRHRLKA